jgi:hypothetical protein
MAEPHVTLDPNQLTPPAQKLRGPLEDQLSSALQLATEKVSADYHGEPVEEVSRHLLEETQAALHPDIAEAFQPGDGELRRVADEIIRLNAGH